MWYETGQTRSSGQYVADKHHGEVKFFYKSGAPAAVRSYQFGQRTGTWTDWDRDGKIILQERYRNGVRVD